MTSPSDPMGERGPTPAILRVLQFAEQQGGSFTMWPVGIARATVERAVKDGLLLAKSPASRVGMMAYILSSAGSRAITLAKSDRRGG